MRSNMLLVAFLKMINVFSLAQYKPPEEWQMKFDLLGTNDINVLGAMLEEQDNELKALKHIPEKVMEDIESLAKKLEGAKKEVDALEEEMKNKNHEAMKLRRKWMKGVEELVETIDKSFGRMMADLGYAGQVLAAVMNKSR